MAAVTVSFATSAGGGAESTLDLDVKGLTPDEIEDLIWREFDFEGSVYELIRFVVGGVYYYKRDGNWVVFYSSWRPTDNIIENRI